ncbi:hypothetical protein [Aureimonas sp. AU22]|uniref:hypothetical protein n=1 Tax=Aureimonas sp. AU22 TaxID=1638162 RepID=UPI0012E3F7CA|nr:hypothetical protein [Aureimonas sp. AU22]
MRAVFAALGADVVTAEVRLRGGETAFDARGRIVDPLARQHLDDLLDRLLDASRALGRQGG